ncbi:MAG: helix-turn-helix domain-containing protein [Clostridia bacterium]|nr:helix-turn-helix domain-containing protein [Clostridia bacterium]
MSAKHGQNPSIVPSRLLLNIQIVADELENYDWSYELRTSNGIPNLKEFCIFSPNMQLCEDTLYYLTEANARLFPIDQYVYVTRKNLKGLAPHISNISDPSVSDFELINIILDIFHKYRDFESRMNYIAINNGSLDDLCSLGLELFNNPLYVHDKNFSVLSLPQLVVGMHKFERGERDGSLHIPLWLVNEFKFDEAYQQTLKQRNASIWGTGHYTRNIRTLFVNIWEGDYYYGRLLINEINSGLKPGQFRIAEIFAEYIKLIIKRDKLTTNHYYKDYEDTIKGLLRGEREPNRKDIVDFLSIKGWDINDEYVCIKFKTQEENLSIHSDTVLRSTLLEEFSDCFDFFYEQRLCLIVNITKNPITISQARGRIATLVRDNYMYCGISNHIEGFMDIRTGFKQTDIVLKYIGEEKSIWVRPFIDISLDYALDGLRENYESNSLILPQLIVFRDYDNEHSTEYLKTLRSYIMNERDIPRTSKELVIHRTTLTHRLEQMDKIIHCDFENSDFRLHLLLSFKLYDRIMGIKQ